MELHKDFIPLVPFLLYACIFMQDFYSQVLQLSSSPADNFFHRAESRRFFCMELQKNGPLQLACYGFAYFAYTRVCGRISCEKTKNIVYNCRYPPQILMPCKNFAILYKFFVTSKMTAQKICLLTLHLENAVETPLG